MKQGMNRFHLAVGFAVALLTAAAAPSAWAWGMGHFTVARETLKRLPGEWGERLRADKELSQLYIRSSHAPDDQQTKLSKWPEYFDAEMLADFPSNAVIYAFHEAPARIKLLRALARAMKRGDAKAVAFMFSCYTHGAADIYAPAHGSLIGLANGCWDSYGIPSVTSCCSVLEKDDKGKALLTRIIDSKADALMAPADDSPEAYYDLLMFEPVLLLEIGIYDEDILASGERGRIGLAHEAARGVWSALKAFEMAVRWSALDEVPKCDLAASAKRAAKRTHDYLAARPLERDTWIRGVLPKKGHVFETGVVYDPLGRWTRGMTYISNRALSVQVATSLAKTRDAGIIDIREVIDHGIPEGMKTLVVLGSGLITYEGFSSKEFLAAVTAFRARGGRLLWIAGYGWESAPQAVFPERDRLFRANPIKPAWGSTNGPVPGKEVPGSKLVLCDGRSFTAVRKPMSHWHQFTMRYILGELPKDAVPTVEFEAKDGTRMVLGFAAPGIGYLPTFAVMPYVFTSAVPSVNPLVMSLDAAGEAVVNATLDRMSAGESRP